MRIAALLAAAGLAVVGSVVVTAPPAAAKGLESATLSGPGLEEPIVVSSEIPHYLGFALTELTQDSLWATEGKTTLPDHLSKRLGTKYTLTWVWSHAPDADPADYTHVQELYPWAYLGPMIHTLPNAYSDLERWVEAPDFLRDILVAYGAPADPDIAPQLVAKKTPASRPEPTNDDPFAIWPPSRHRRHHHVHRRPRPRPPPASPRVAKLADIVMAQVHALTHAHDDSAR